MLADIELMFPLYVVEFQYADGTWNQWAAESTMEKAEQRRSLILQEYGKRDSDKGRVRIVPYTLELFKAAPKLLFQLERYVALHEGDCVETDEQSTLLREAVAVIKEAKGETP